MKIFSDKNLTLLLSKLSLDFLVLFMFAYGMILLAEAILPGIVSSRISMTSLTWTLIATLVISAFLSKKSGQKNEPTAPQKNSFLFWMLSVLFLIIILLSLFGFSLWEIIITTMLTLAIASYAKKEIF